MAALMPIGVSTITNKGIYSRLYIINDEFAGVSIITNKCMYIFEFKTI